QKNLFTGGSMDRQTQDHIAKFICIAVGGVIALYVLRCPISSCSWRSVVPGTCIRSTSATTDAIGINQVHHSTTQPLNHSTKRNHRQWKTTTTATTACSRSSPGKAFY